MTVPTQREASLPSGAPHRSSSSSEHTKAPGSGRSASPIAPPRAAVAPAAAACSASGGDTCAPTRAAAHCLPVSTLCHSFRAGPSPIQAQAVGPVARPPLFKSVPCHPPARICTHPARGAVSTPCPQNRDEAGVGASSPPLTPCVRLPCMALGPSGRPAPEKQHHLADLAPGEARTPSDDSVRRGAPSTLHRLSSESVTRPASLCGSLRERGRSKKTPACKPFSPPSLGGVRTLVVIDIL